MEENRYRESKQPLSLSLIGIGWNELKEEEAMRGGTDSLEEANEKVVDLELIRTPENYTLDSIQKQKDVLILVDCTALFKVFK